MNIFMLFIEESKFIVYKNDLFISGVKKFLCVLYYLEVLEVVIVVYLVVFL